MPVNIAVMAAIERACRNRLADLTHVLHTTRHLGDEWWRCTAMIRRGYKRSNLAPMRSTRQIHAARQITIAHNRMRTEPIEKAVRRNPLRHSADRRTETLALDNTGFGIVIDPAGTHQHVVHG